MDVTPEWPLLGFTHLPIDEEIDFAQIGYKPGKGIILVTDADGKAHATLMQPDIAAKLADGLYRAIYRAGFDKLMPPEPGA